MWIYYWIHAECAPLGMPKILQTVFKQAKHKNMAEIHRIDQQKNNFTSHVYQIQNGSANLIPFSAQTMFNANKWTFAGVFCFSLSVICFIYAWF